jgi:hypothetical protein
VKQIRKRITYANVMSSIAVFLVLGGAAVAANQLGKNTVGSKQLKKNAVTSSKIKKNAVTGAKIKKGSVGGAKITDGAVTSSDLANGAVTGEKINSGSTSFSQITDRIRGTVTLPFTGGLQIYPLNNPTYTQPTGRTDQYVPGLDIKFAASCTPPRSAYAYVLLDAENPASPTPFDIMGQGLVFDQASGDVTRHMSFGPYSSSSYIGTSSLAPSSATNHTFSFVLLGGSCNSGSGVSAVGGGVDVIGTK